VCILKQAFNLIVFVTVTMVATHIEILVIVIEFDEIIFLEFRDIQYKIPISHEKIPFDLSFN